MERCLTDEPPLLPMSTSEEHHSACWLPPELTGMADATDAARRRASAAARGKAARKVAGKLADAPERGAGEKGSTP
jgi:hypothetical protein